MAEPLLQLCAASVVVNGQALLTDINLEIYDLNELEAHFLSGNLDIIFTSKSPGRQKFKYLHELGFQILEKIQSNKNYALLSSFEYGPTR